jgi:hypothetical protein
MTYKSAREQLDKREDGSHICFPSAVDSLLPVSKLPDEYYDLFSENYHNPNASHNKVVNYLLNEFFGVEALPDSDLAAVAKFNAFGASPQVYMPDAAYDYVGEEEYFQKNGVTPQQLRFVSVLRIARANECIILFTNNLHTPNEHVSALQMVDEGEDSDAAKYVVRDYVDVQGKKLYGPYELAGVPQTLGNSDVGDFTPLPTVQRSYFPNEQSSWELTILPLDPKL